MSRFCINFALSLPPFWQAWTPQIELILTPIIDPTESKHWTSRLSHTILLQIRFLVDFGGSKTSPGRLQGGSRRLKRAPKRCQDVSKTAKDASGHFQDGFRRSPLLARNVSQFTTHNEQIRVHKWKFTDHHLQFHILDRSQFWIHTS